MNSSTLGYSLTGGKHNKDHLQFKFFPVLNNIGNVGKLHYQISTDKVSHTRWRFTVDIIPIMKCGIEHDRLIPLTIDNKL